MTLTTSVRLPLLGQTFWRACLSQFHPKMIWLTVAPTLISAALWVGLLYLMWEPVVSLVRHFLDRLSWLDRLYQALTFIGLAAFKIVLAPLLVIVAVLPFVVLTALLLISLFSMPAIVRHVARRFPALQTQNTVSTFASLGWSLWSSFLFLVVWVLTLPLWLIPPLGLIIPFALWGWLSYRVMSFDALVAHTNSTQRRAVLRAHRTPLLLIGILTGAAGSAPTLLWMSSLLALVLFPIILAATIWLYTWIFVFSGLWFAHYCLAALDELNRTLISAQPAIQSDVPPALPDSIHSNHSI